MNMHNRLTAQRMNPTWFWKTLQWDSSLHGLREWDDDCPPLPTSTKIWSGLEIWSSWVTWKIKRHIHFIPPKAQSQHSSELKALEQLTSYKIFLREKREGVGNCITGQEQLLKVRGFDDILTSPDLVTEYLRNNLKLFSSTSLMIFLISISSFLL